MKSRRIQNLDPVSFRERVKRLTALLESCSLCPRNCGTDRTKGHKGYCQSGRLPRVSDALLHLGEEPPISGIKGSGTVFFSNCNLRCVFCQNWQISQKGLGNEISVRALANAMLRLQKQGAHNINLVSPTHFVPQITEALYLATQDGLVLPIVYNSNGYDSLAVLELLIDIIDIYMPDLKYGSDSSALALSDAPDYCTHAQAALACMYEQVGNLSLDKDGIAYGGMLIRHLVLPENLADSHACLRYIKEHLSTNVTLSIMSQYHPCYKASSDLRLARPITKDEYRCVVEEAVKLGFTDLLVQGLDSSNMFLPDFEKEQPFEDKNM